MSARAWAAFATVSTLWGIPYLFIKIAVDDGVPPAFLAFVRVALGAAVLMALAWRAGALGALRGRGRWLALYALFEIVVPFPLIAAGERHVAPSLAAIIIAAVPIFVALLALRFDRAERATGSRLVGLIMGLAGGVALVGLGGGGGGGGLRGAHRGRGEGRGAPGPRGHPRRRRRLCRGADGLQAHARRPRPARRDGREPGRGGRGARPAGGSRPAHRPALGGRARGARRARDLLHRGGIRLLRRAHRGGRPRARARHHLRGPRRRGRARRDRPGRAPRRGRCGRPAAHPRRLVAVDRRAPAATAGGRRHPRARAARGTARGTAFAPDERPLYVDVVLDNRRRLKELHRERTLAQMTPLAGEPAYMADLEDEILVTEAASLAGAVTEIASLRARLGGRQWG